MVYDPNSFTSAAQLPTQGDPRMQGLMEALQSGFKTSQMPRQAQQESTGADLRNKSLQEQLQQTQYATPQKKMESEQQQMLYSYLQNAFGQGGQASQGQQMSPQHQQQMQQGQMSPGQHQQQMQMDQQQQPNIQSPNFDTSALNQPIEQGQEQLGQLNTPGISQRPGINPQSPDGVTSPGDVNVVRESNPGMDKIDEAYYSNPMVKKFLEGQGYKEKISTHQDPASGQVFQTIEYPSGKIEQRAYKIGDKPEDVTERKEVAKERVKYRGELANNYSAVQDNLANTDMALKLLEDNPNAKNVIGPVNQHMARLFGKDEDRELLGQLSTTSGNVALDAAKAIKGAFTGRDLGLINSMKFNPADTYGQFVGKLKAMKILNENVAKKVEFIDKQMGSGMSRIEAMKAARETMGLDEVTSEVKGLMRGVSAEQNQQPIDRSKYTQKNGKWYAL